ncbi:hypothetical protein Tco_0543278 [Tanacetum coccineum]
MKKRPYDDQDPPKNHKGRRIKKHKLFSKSYSGKEQVTFESIDYDLLLTSHVDMKNGSLKMHTHIITGLIKKQMCMVNLESNTNRDQELVADYSKLAPLVGPRFNQRVPIEHFFNDDLEYLMHRNKERMYALSLTKCPTAEYTISWIKEDINRFFRSSVADYDDDAELGIHHWLDMRKGLYKTRRASLTKYGVHSNYMIITVKHVEVERQFDYGFLSSIKAQGKLHHLEGQAEYDLANSLRIYIRKEVIKKRVDDV